MSKYLDRFDSIRLLQSYLVGCAERTGTPVVENETADLATRAVSELVLSAAERV
jgi:2-phosphoglycerate kinase